ncbi:MAG: M48 family metallopeptidase [Myxococcota bacterium]
MASDFFELQDDARRNTKRLVLLFVLAVIGMTATLYLAAAVLVGYGQDPYTGATVWNVRWVDPLLMLQIGMATALVVGGASLYRIASLAGGGKAVAESLGATLIHANSRDPLERRVLNVVEEMSIASGTPTPPVYMMQDEPGINAFAAGFTPSDAVVAVSRGCVEQLSRDELQGVVGHEFSHILNGDMRLNIRLMGVLFGILVVGLIGNVLLRSSLYGSVLRRRDSRDNSTQVLLVIGGVMMLVGFIGTIVGNLIKASVSRQREFLADASAVQFTRNPSGIAGALKKIGGFEAGSEMMNPHAPESSHMFFGRAVSSGLNSLFATHPPLEERIARLDPSWQADGEARPSAPVSAAGPASELAMGFLPEPADHAVAQIGTITQKHLQYANDLIASLPRAVIDAAHEPYGARAVIYALLVNAEPEARARQLEILPSSAEPDVWKLMQGLLPEVGGLEAGVRLPLIDLALPALRELSPDQYRRFTHVVSELAKADDRISIFEWTLQRILLTHLRPHFEGVARQRHLYRGFKRLADPCEQVFSALVAASSNADAVADQAFADAAGALQLSGLRLISLDEIDLPGLDAALDALSGLTPPLKSRFLSACAQLITADHEVTLEEAELFRAIADTLGCPVPPLLPGQALIRT